MSAMECAQPVITRRRLIGSAALGFGGMILPGCATTPGARSEMGCLPRVEVAHDHIARTVVGLRPYRASGFVVRAESLGPKKLVHNYGHGGAGITLGWGTSRLAADLGLPGHQGPVAVIGAGIVGLTTARLAQEAGFPVTIYAKALPPETVSNIAAGEVSPSLHYERSAVTPEWRRQFAAAADYSYRRFETMIGDDYGVRWVRKYAGYNRLPMMRTETDWLGPHEHPFPFSHVRQRRVMLVETPRFLRRMMRDVQAAGGKIEVREFATPAEMEALPERLVFNCTGLGSRALFGDTELRPGRGQLVILPPQPEVDYAWSDGAGYMFSRSDGILLGGTFDLDNWSTDPDPETTRRLIAHHQRVFGGFRCTMPA